MVRIHMGDRTAQISERLYFLQDIPINGERPGLCLKHIASAFTLTVPSNVVDTLLGTDVAAPQLAQRRRHSTHRTKAGMVTILANVESVFGVSNKEMLAHLDC